MREMTVREHPLWQVVLLSLLLVGSSRVSAFGVTPGQKCVGAKAKAFGAALYAEARCQATARFIGAAVDPGCVLKAEAKLLASYAKAEVAGACPGNALRAVAVTTACVATFDGAMGGNGPCAAAKLRAAGKKAQDKTKCAQKAALRGVAIDPECLVRVETKFVAAVAKADSLGVCTGTAPALEALVDACLVPLQPPIPCTGGAGHPICDGTCAAGLTCRPYEVFANGASSETGCACVDVAVGPACGGTTCGTDQHCADPTEVCERWMTDDPLGCDHMICQPAMTTPTTLPPGEMIFCDGGEFPTCGGACQPGMRCQTIEAFLDGIVVFTGCACVDPRGVRCEMPTECDIGLVPFSHCADPTKVCLVAVITEGEKAIGCLEAHCGVPPSTTTSSTSSTSMSSTTTTSTTSTSTSSTSTSTSTSTSLPCTSTPGVSGCFTDLGDCTIHDTCTGLQWEQKSATPGPHQVADRYVWAGCCGDGCNTMCQPNAAASATCLALAEGGTEGCGTYCPADDCYTGRDGAITTVWDWINQLNSENFAGHSDWRLPKEAGLNPTGARELESIAQTPCGTPPCIDPLFGPTTSYFYWSATQNVDRAVEAWFVNFADANYGHLLKREAGFIRAVR